MRDIRITLLRINFSGGAVPKYDHELLWKNMQEILMKIYCSVSADFTKSQATIPSISPWSGLNLSRRDLFNYTAQPSSFPPINLHILDSNLPMNCLITKTPNQSSSAIHLMSSNEIRMVAALVFLYKSGWSATHLETRFRIRYLVQNCSHCCNGVDLISITMHHCLGNRSSVGHEFASCCGLDASIYGAQRVALLLSDQTLCIQISAFPK